MPGKCGRCGNELLSVYKFCNFCGKEIFHEIDVDSLWMADIKEETYQYKKEIRTKYEAFLGRNGVSLGTFQIPDTVMAIQDAYYQEEEQILWIFAALENSEFRVGSRVQRYGLYRVSGAGKSVKRILDFEGEPSEKDVLTDFSVLSDGRGMLQYGGTLFLIQKDTYQRITLLENENIYVDCFYSNGSQDMISFGQLGDKDFKTYLYSDGEVKAISVDREFYLKNIRRLYASKVFEKRPDAYINFDIKVEYAKYDPLKEQYMMRVSIPLLDIKKEQLTISLSTGTAKFLNQTIEEELPEFIPDAPQVPEQVLQNIQELVWEYKLMYAMEFNTGDTEYRPEQIYCIYQYQTKEETDQNGNKRMIEEIELAMSINQCVVRVGVTDGRISEMKLLHPADAFGMQWKTFLECCKQSYCPSPLHQNNMKKDMILERFRMQLSGLCTWMTKLKWQLDLEKGKEKYDSSEVSDFELNRCVYQVAGVFVDSTIYFTYPPKDKQTGTVISDDNINGISLVMNLKEYGYPKTVTIVYPFSQKDTGVWVMPFRNISNAVDWWRTMSKDRKLVQTPCVLSEKELPVPLRNFVQGFVDRSGNPIQECMNDNGVTEVTYSEWMTFSTSAERKEKHGRVGKEPYTVYYHSDGRNYPISYLSGISGLCCDDTGSYYIKGNNIYHMDAASRRCRKVCDTSFSGRDMMLFKVYNNYLVMTFATYQETRSCEFNMGDGEVFYFSVTRHLNIVDKMTGDYIVNNKILSGPLTADDIRQHGVNQFVDNLRSI